MSIFTPTNIQELQEMAMLLTGHNQRDAMNLIQVFAAFGDFFGGDLQGVIDKTSYLHSLDLSQIWFNPITVSPDNHGYAVDNY